MDARCVRVHVALCRQRQAAKVPLRTRLDGRAGRPILQQRPGREGACELRLHRDADVIASCAGRLGANLHLARVQAGVLRGDAQVHQRQCQPLQGRCTVHRQNIELAVAYADELRHRGALDAPGRHDLHVQIGPFVPGVGPGQAHPATARPLRSNALNGGARPHAGRCQRGATHEVVFAGEKALHGGHGSECARAAPCSIRKTL